MRHSIWPSRRSQFTTRSASLRREGEGGPHNCLAPSAPPFPHQHRRSRLRYYFPFHLSHSKFTRYIVLRQKLHYEFSSRSIREISNRSTYEDSQLFAIVSFIEKQTISVTSARSRQTTLFVISLFPLRRSREVTRDIN